MRQNVYFALKYHVISNIYLINNQNLSIYKVKNKILIVFLGLLILFQFTFTRIPHCCNLVEKNISIYGGIISKMIVFSNLIKVQEGNYGQNRKVLTIYHITHLFQLKSATLQVKLKMLRGRCFYIHPLIRSNSRIGCK